MGKKFKTLKWESVALEGFPVSVTENLQGFVGLEECTEYGLEKNDKKTKKKKEQKANKRKITKTDTKEVPHKKVKLNNGFVVESCSKTIPSLSEQQTTNNKEQHIKDNETKMSNGADKKTKKRLKIGENINTSNNLTPEDMLSWAEFKLPEEIIKALAELGFKQPTKIQQMALPAAIHGRRDILGAAETGSGKTLAFGLPILAGIMKLKEKAEAGLDVYEIPYKKSSTKKKVDKEHKVVKTKGRKKISKKIVKANKESSEDGYSSDDDTDNDNVDKNNDSKNNDDFLEEYDVPIKKKETSTDEGNDSDSSDNYVHLSDMLDSDDVTDSDSVLSDGENQFKDGSDASRIDSNEDDNISDASEENNEIDSDDNDDINDANEGSNDNNADDSDISEEAVSQNDEDGGNEGTGCVKVIDDVEMPSDVMIKTGKPLYALIITPTRELAMQIGGHLIAAAKYTGIKVAVIVGGMASVKQERVLNKGPEIVVATPGRLWELINQGQPHLQQLHSVRFLAIDETDRMIERGHFEELQPLLERLNVDEAKRSTRQNFVFSATLTLVHDLPSHMKGKKVTKRGKILNRKVQKMTPQQKIKRLIDMIGMTEPKVVDITTENQGTAETLTECRITCSLEHKDSYLYYILKRHPGRTIVFCNSIGCVKRLAQLFTLLKCRPLPLHASMAQRQRLKNLERFRDDPRGVLIATDVAARGLDIPNVDHVIHYQVPRTAENYVHRSGRTARATKEGLTILMMEPAEAYLYSKICHTLNKTSSLPLFPVSSVLLPPLRDTVSLARDVDALELKRRRAAQAHGWKERAARDMDMIIDDDDCPVKEVDPKIEKALQVKRRQLTAMLSKPLFPKGFSFKYPTLNDPMAFTNTDENALQVMKKAIESGDLRKEKRRSKNAPLLKLEKTFKNV